jgi:hypothetical protein
LLRAREASAEFFVDDWFNARAKRRETREGRRWTRFFLILAMRARRQEHRRGTEQA